MTDICTFSDGDGIGGFQKYIGNTATAQECAYAVKVNYAFANGATWGNVVEMSTFDNRHGMCYAEIGVTANNSDSFWKTCQFKIFEGTLT